MLNIDLNLIVLLDSLLIECNVTKAAKRSNLSVSAMSRALTRLRVSLQDPLLIKSGRTMVLTPYAVSIKDQVTQLVYQLEHVFVAPKNIDLDNLAKHFTLRASVGFAENYGTALLSLMRQQAPNVSLRIISKEIKHTQQLKQGDIDAEIGVIGDNTDIEMMSRLLFNDYFIAVCHKEHPITQQQITLDLLSQYDFVGVQRQSPLSPQSQGSCVNSLTGLSKSAIINVSGFSTAMTIASQSQLIAIVPERFTRQIRHSLFKQSLHTFQLPFAMATLSISLLWHPRMNNDLSHMWFRECLWQVCQDINNPIT
ncbi:MAG: LysR family transcriptional regulator [Providencia heimbachae]|nr:LysR family transcriptional regulator [Providencia heimbachae]